MLAGILNQRKPFKVVNIRWQGRFGPAAVLEDLPVSVRIAMTAAVTVAYNFAIYGHVQPEI